MVSLKLIDDLKIYLKKAEEVWVAVALMKDAGLEELLLHISKNAKQNYLIGIDLPTSPSALRVLQEMNVKAGLIDQAETFHPKLYIIKTSDELVSFVGSANLTKGGLINNIELSIKSLDAQMNSSLIAKFEQWFSIAYPLTDDNINQYEIRYKKLSETNEKLRKETPKIKLTRPPSTIDPLAGIDFTTRFFKKEHHLAFRGELWEKRTNAANIERSRVYDRFIELHNVIHPQFDNYGLDNLYHHNNPDNIVSHYYHVDGFTSKQLDSMWLSYGKSENAILNYQSLYEPDLKKTRDKQRSVQTFSHHARLQIRVELKLICIWLFFGKKNGSAIDRSFFQKNMKSPAYRDSIYSMIASLPEGYYISLSRDNSKYVNEFTDAIDLYNFIKKDRPENHFYIGKDYEISEPEMSDVNLPTTVLTEFKRLYQLYNLMRDTQFG